MADETCNSNNTGPAFELAVQTGLPQCADLHTTGPAPPCDNLQACAQFYQLIKEGDGQSFVFSAGGPFELPVPGAPTNPYVCPPQVAPSFLGTIPTDPSVYAKPTILSDIVCMSPNMSIGTYHAYTRMETRNFTPGSRVQVLYLPDCEDDSVAYVVLDYYAPCAPACVEQTALTAFLPPAWGTIEGELVVPATTCRPGFALKVSSGQRQCANEASIRPNIRNFQFELERLTARELIPQASPLVADAGVIGAKTTCSCPG